MFELAKFLSANQKIQEIGVGVAGVVDQGKGILVTSPNLKYIKNFKLSELLRSYGFEKVKIDNDASCFTRAEAVLGQAKNYQNIVGIILGTGIGSGLYINGQDFRGSHNSGGEIGQLMVGHDTLEHHYQKAKAKNDFKEIGRLLAVRLADLINIFDPDCIIFGGSVSLLHHKKFLPQALNLAKKYIVNKKLKPKMAVSRLQSAGAIGAALLIK
jgi:glucokinase